MARVVRGLVVVAVGLAFVAASAVEAPADDPASAGRPGLVRQTAQKQVKKKARKGRVAGKSESDPEPSAPEIPVPNSAGAAALKFSKDIAPILVANCSGCHNPRQKRGKFDMSSFELLMKGTAEHAVIVPGKPEASHLVLRIRGEETPAMPQGANRELSEEAIVRIENWVRAGALLDAGVDPKAPMEKYAATPEDLRKLELARMSPDQRDQHVETVGRERWKKASPKTTPEVTASSHFLLFGNLPKTRAASATKALEQQYTQLRPLLGPNALEWGEKASLYVFNDRVSFIEFVRAVENREVEASESGSARFNLPEPYVAVVDPQGGRDEAPAGSTASKRVGKTKRGESDGGGGTAERSLPGVLTEQFVIGTVNSMGKPPRWLSFGLGAYYASRVEPRAAYFATIRRDVGEIARQAWVRRANDALGDATKAEEVRAIGFVILESMMNSPYRTALPGFIRGMAGGMDRLDNVLGDVLNLSREQFLSGTGEFATARYGAGR